jgi:CRP/FNR family cyclic AMP-dependent transcriptional regulator
MSPAPKIDLGEVWLFKGCSKAERKAIERNAVEKHVAKGEVVVDEGAVGQSAYVIVSGSVAVLRHGRKVAELGEGQMFGEIALLDRLPRTASVKALSDLTLLELHQKEFDAVLKESPSTTRKLLSAVASRLRETDAKLAV